jgi:hypothetical protein
MSERVVPVCNRPDYRIGLEQDSGCTFVHATVHRWTASVARALRRDADTIMALHGGPIYATTHEPHGGDYAKHAKFVRHFGFEYLTTVDAGGSAHRVFVRKA